MRNYKYIDSLSLDKKVSFVNRLRKKAAKLGSSALLNRARDLKSHVQWGMFEEVGE